MSKRAGRHSQQANDFLEPKPVENLTASNVGTSRGYNDGAASLSWSLPAGSPPATLYTITSTPTSTTETTTDTSYTFPGLSSNTAYTFTVVASNAAGSSAGTTSSSITITTVPQAPQSPTASSTTANEDTVSWTAGASGGSTITSYTIVSSDGPSYTNATSPKTISETGGTSQSYTIYALNANGTSAGAVTSSITTVSPFFPPFFPPYFPFFPPFFPPYFPPYFPYFPPYFPYFPPYFPYFPYFPGFGPYFPPYFPYFPGFKGPKGCIDGNTRLALSNGEYVQAKDIVVGDKIMTIDPSGLEGSNIIDASVNINVNLIEVEVESVEQSISDVVSFNNTNVFYSNAQPIIINVDGKFTHVAAENINIGDSIISVDVDTLTINETIVESIETDSDRDVYDIRTTPYQWYITENNIVIS